LRLWSGHATLATASLMIGVVMIFLDAILT
jgi:hypothetical protein